MLSFIIYKDSAQVEIVADSDGIDELISYLQEVKNDKDHMHLIEGNELYDYPLHPERKSFLSCASKVDIYFEEKGE